MTNREGETPQTELTWTKKREWGSEGLTHHSTTEIHGEKWSFQVLSPKKGEWRLQAWHNDEYALYREDRTVAGAKAQAQAYAELVATATCGECKAVDGHTVDCVVQRMILASEGEIVDLRDAAEDERAAGNGILILPDELIDTVTIPASPDDLMDAFTNAVMGADQRLTPVTMSKSTYDLYRNGIPVRDYGLCHCPTPTHRMSCGVGSVPKVVSR